MSKKLAEGDAIQMTDRDVTAADTKSGLFYPHYRGLKGVLGKIYSDGTATVHVEEGSLPPDVRERHLSGSQAMRQKWLDGLSDEARNRLSAAEKKFALRYTILVSVSDVSAADTAATSLPSSADSSEPVRKSLADMEAEEARHLAEVAKKAQG